jgi:D-alanyl-D-alanine carboxypeptidase
MHLFAACLDTLANIHSDTFRRDYLFVGAVSLFPMMNLCVRWTGVLGLGWVLAAGAVSAAAQSGLPVAVASGIDAVSAKVLEATGVPSASVAVVQGGKLVYAKAYGKARLEPVMAAAPGMQYSIGSVSKQFTAAMMLLLVSAGADAGE